jgi:exopolysaccharide biosynthesis protein
LALATSPTWSELGSGIAHPLAESRAESKIAPGLKHLSIRRGQPSSELVYRVIAGNYRSQKEADIRIQTLEQAGFTVTPIYTSGSYKIVVGRFADHAEALETQQQISALDPTQELRVQEVRQDIANPTGPWSIHVLLADPEYVSVQVVHAFDAAIGVETTAALARRRGALAAINGGYYLESGLTRGDSQGTLMIDGTLLSEPDRGRAAVGFDADGKSSSALFGRLRLRGNIRLSDDQTIAIDGINRRRKADEVIVYTPEFHRTTLTSPAGTEVRVEEGTVADTRIGEGSSLIPASGFVISLGEAAAAQYLSLFEIGGAVSLETSLQPMEPGESQDWSQVEWIVSGGPLLLWQGRRVNDFSSESISRTFYSARHPRTAVGLRADGTLLLVTVDGRQPHFSVGMSLPELTDLFLELGAESAVNLDGGGSTSMVVEGRRINSPSDPLGDRMNADAVVVFPID